MNLPDSAHAVVLTSQPIAKISSKIIVVKKSSAVPAALCAAVGVAILEGCSSPSSVRRCVDPGTGQILADTMCSSPITATSYRGGRYALMPDSKGVDICFDTKTNLAVDRSFCRAGHRYTPGFVYMGLGRALSRPSWGYDGQVSNGRVRGYSSNPPSGASVRTPSGTTISRGGFGSSGKSSGGFSS